MVLGPYKQAHVLDLAHKRENREKVLEIAPIPSTLLTGSQNWYSALGILRNFTVVFFFLGIRYKHA